MHHSRPIFHMYGYNGFTYLYLLILLRSLSFASAQTRNDTAVQNPYANPNFKPSMAVTIVVLVGAFIFMGFFSIYIRHCTEQGRNGGGSVRPINVGRRSRRVARGLDLEVIETFPTFIYSVVKGLKIGKGALECAVCLNEFEDDETLRLIPKCDHVFHPECIDVWLDSHTTCPVCRANLKPDVIQVTDSDNISEDENVSSEVNQLQNQVSIRVIDDQIRDSVPDVINPNQIPVQNRPARATSMKPNRFFGKFPRSHSTGHSIVQPGENCERFTLKLPEDVRKQIVNGKLNRTTSCITFPTRQGSISGGSIREGSSRWKSFRFGRSILQAHIVKLGFGSEVFVQNTLLDFYSRCSENLGFARRVFDEMVKRDVVSWNSMIGAYMTHGETVLAMGLFGSMTERNVVSWNSIITGLSRAGAMESAQSIFEQMPVRNEVSWNSMICGYVRKGDVRNARLIFDRMPGKSVVSWTAMVTGYTKVGDLKSASDLFESMAVKNVVSWNAMIAGYVQNHMYDHALCVFHQMLIDGNCIPDEATLISVLSACAHLGTLEQGKWIDSYIKKNKYDMSISLANALIDMFAKCGDVGSAKTVFHQMTKRCIITWTTMVSGLAINGKCREALSLFDTMCTERVEPDDVIFIATLSACTHGGLVEEGKRVFNQMVQQLGVEPRIEHYGCMVDLLSRAGKLEEAFRFIMTMPMKPNAVIWATLLGSCKIYGEQEFVEVATKKILELEPLNPSYLMMISNLNASIGRWEDVLSVREAMRKEGLDKVPGCSSIQVGNKVYEFLVKDTTDEQRMEIYETLDVLNDQLKAFGDVL